MSYYTTVGALDYNNVLNHFKKQAEGKPKTKIIGKNGKSHLIVIDASKKDKEDPPKLQVIVPAEAATKMAESQLKEDIKTKETKKHHQSVTDRHRSKKVAKRKREEVRDAKDIFDKKWRKQ